MHATNCARDIIPALHGDIITFRRNTEICLGRIQYHSLCYEFSSYLQSFPMKSKSNNDIILAFTLMIAFFQQYGFVVQIIHSDFMKTPFSVLKHS